MIIKRFSIQCGNCGQQSNEINDGESIREVRQINKAEGWIYKKMKNRSYWDLCPKCKLILFKKVQL